MPMPCVHLDSLAPKITHVFCGTQRAAQPIRRAHPHQFTGLARLTGLFRV